MSRSNNPLRVAFLGNMNNNHFALARYLRETGFDCTLFLFNNEFEHFHPKCDTYDLGYTDWVKTLKWGGLKSFFKISSRQIRTDMTGYDILVGCGLAPALLYKADLKLDVMIPYGSDMWESTFYTNRDAILTLFMPVLAQRKGMRQTKVVHRLQTNHLYEKQIKTLFPYSLRWYEGIPMIHAPTYDRSKFESILQKTHWGGDFMRIRSSNDFMMVAHGRHEWGGVGDPNSKGNDILLSGWSLFCKRTPSLSKKLVLLEYGGDVGKSKEYISRLNIPDTVAWFPLMYRKDLMPALMMADVIASQFAHSWIECGVLYEALVAGTPILAYRDETLYEDAASLYPIYNAKTPEAIADHLVAHVANPGRGQRMGEIGRLWYDQNVVAPVVKRYGDLFENRARELNKEAR